MPKSETSAKQRVYQGHVAAAQAQGMSLARYAREHGLRPHVLYDASRRMRSPFVRVRANTSPARSEPLQARLPNGVVLSLALDLDALPQVVCAFAAL